MTMCYVCLTNITNSLVIRGCQLDVGFIPTSDKCGHGGAAGTHSSPNSMPQFESKSDIMWENTQLHTDDKQFILHKLNHLYVFVYSALPTTHHDIPGSVFTKIHRTFLRITLKSKNLLIYLGFYVTLITVQVISRWVVGRAEEASTYSWTRFCTVNSQPTTSNYQLSHFRPCWEPNPSLKAGR